MEEPKPNNHEDDNFFDALDEFPFFDCSDTFESQNSTLSQLQPIERKADDSFKPQHSPEAPSPTALRRRRTSLQHNRREISGTDPKDSNFDSPVSSEINPIHDSAVTTRRRNLKDNERECERSDSFRVRLSNENSTITSENKDRVDDSAPVDSHSEEIDESSSNFLVLLAGLVIKAIGFQFSILISFFTFPIWLIYCSYVLVIDPFRAVRRCRVSLMNKLLRMWGVVCESVSPLIYEWLKEHKSIWKLALQFGWGLLWSAYVCFILFGFLVSSFVISGLVMRYVVEEPIRLEETLSFDYTKNSPVAFVPIVSCPRVSCGVNCWEKIDVGKTVGSRVIPPNHKLQATVSLTLPESEYNRNLGIFQVRVDFLSAYGRALASSSHPCMLRFKSQPISVLLTFLKIVPLLAGYLSESQTLSLKFRGFTEGDVPTACLKVIIEQRAEYRPGAGIPELYAASLILESELPLFKRILWYWKKTIFIWITMMFFAMELMLALLCCRPIIIPRAKPRDGSGSTSAPQNGHPVQR